VDTNRTSLLCGLAITFLRIRQQYLVKWVSLTLRESSCTMEHPLAQQVKFGSSIHLPLDTFEFIHLAFRLSVTILNRQRCSHSVEVPVHPCSETAQFHDPARTRFV
jgi:hypothetical protein